MIQMPRDGQMIVMIRNGLFVWSNKSFSFFQSFCLWHHLISQIRLVDWWSESNPVGSPRRSASELYVPCRFVINLLFSKYFGILLSLSAFFLPRSTLRDFTFGFAVCQINFSIWYHNKPLELVTLLYQHAQQYIKAAISQGASPDWIEPLLCASVIFIGSAKKF